MIYFVKKLAGMGLVVLGGLGAAHGGATGQTWELLAGLLVVLIGVLLLVLKIVRRNLTHGGHTPMRVETRE
jgi:hypothetical protein